MKKISSILLIGLFFASTVAAQDESRASKTWEVQKYDVAATLPQTEADRYLTVKAGLDLKNVSGAAGSRLTLRISDKAEVSAVRVNNAATDFTKGEEKIGSRNLQRIIIRVPSVQPNAIFAVAVDYKLKVDENSGLNAISPVNSQFLPLSFWYPTPNSWFFARGADYAPFNLQVVSLSLQTIVSSGSQAVRTEVGNTSINNFEQKLKGQPFFVAGNWEVIEASGISVYLLKGASADERKRAGELANLVADAKIFTANLLGAAPDVPLKIVAVNRGAGFSGGGTIFVDQSALQRQKIDSQTAMAIAEAVAKIWIGSAVGVSGDGQGAVSEGLTRFIATQFLEKQYGREIADLERLRQRQSYAAIVQRDAPLNIVSPLDDYYFPAVANKGAMIWRLLAKQVGQDEFFAGLRSQMRDGNLSLNELRQAFPAQKDFLDYSFDKVTDTNLLVGLPQTSGAEAKLALRNNGSTAATVNVSAVTASGETLNSQTTIAAKSFGEVSFKTNGKIVRAEVDADKFYPQTDYFDDVVPREIDSNDPIVFIKRAFDQQDFAKAEKNARTVLQVMPHNDDARTWLARSLLAQGKNSDAEKEFRAVLDEKLPTARSLAWANAGLGDIALKGGQTAPAANFFGEAIKSNAEYGATLAARQGRGKVNASAAIDESVKAFFAQFDKAAVSSRKADVDKLILAGEIPKFSSGISGQAEQWQTQILSVDKIDADTIWAEVNLSVKLLGKNAENGTAVYRLTKVGNNWKVSGVDVFEIR